MRFIMFTDTKYTRWYFDIITRSAARAVTGYCENHHIIPQCIGGDDSSSNIARLTAREHFICHVLLTKMHPSHKLKFALHMMSLNNSRQQRGYTITSRMYEYIKRGNALASSIRSTGRSKHNVGKKLFHNPSTGIEGLFFPETPPTGWVPGTAVTSLRRHSKYKNHVYYHNPSTTDTIHLPPTTLPPTGYVKGNPNAALASLCSPKRQFYNPSTGQFIKATTCPAGYIPGNPMMWVNDGVISKQINKITDAVEPGWNVGRVAAASLSVSMKAARAKPIETPLGRFEHPNRFAEVYKCDASVVKLLDTKIRLRDSNKVLIAALQQVHYDFTKTKAENGFRFI